MLRKMIIPLFAVVLAFASAFAAPVVQIGWFKDGTGAGVQGTIDTPGDSPACLTTNTHFQCLIGSAQAYDTQAHAVAGGPTGMLKYQ